MKGITCRKECKEFLYCCVPYNPIHFLTGWVTFVIITLYCPALVVAKRAYLYYMMVHNPLTIHNILDVSYVVIYVVVRALGSVGGVTMAWPVYRHNVKVCVGNGAVNTLCHMFKHQGVTYM